MLVPPTPPPLITAWAWSIWARSLSGWSCRRPGRDALAARVSAGAGPRSAGRAGPTRDSLWLLGRRLARPQAGPGGQRPSAAGLEQPAALNELEVHRVRLALPGHTKLEAVAHHRLHEGEVEAVRVAPLAGLRLGFPAGLGVRREDTTAARSGGEAEQLGDRRVEHVRGLEHELLGVRLEGLLGALEVEPLELGLEQLADRLLALRLGGPVRPAPEGADLLRPVGRPFGDRPGVAGRLGDHLRERVGDGTDLGRGGGCPRRKAVNGGPGGGHEPLRDG